jgi:glycosyltransferase involved in cell wall biosynthesis
MKKVSVVIPCFNEEENVNIVYDRTTDVFRQLPAYEYEIIFIDNDSTDRTVSLLREIAARDKRVKVIVNSRNFGHLRSPFHALMNTTGDAALMMAADLQDPPELILDFVRKWEEGNDIVLAIKDRTDEKGLLPHVRKLYYFFLASISENEVVQGFHGYSLLDRKVVEAIRLFHDPLPFFRSMLLEAGFRRAVVRFCQPTRRRGVTANNLYSLYDTAMLGIVQNSKVPLRIAIFVGFTIACGSFAIAIGYLIRKVLYWDDVSLGIAPLLIGLFFLSGTQLIFLGVIGEYIGALCTQVKNRPLVIERERINF